MIRRGRAELVETIDDDWLESSADPDAAPHWRAIGATSILMLPLVAGETRGALTLIRAGTAGPFDQQQRALGEKFAQVSATALQNAQLYDAARHANLARDEVLGVVSHDLRNPLSAISMCARVLEESPPANDAERRELLATIRESTEWMNRLIEDLLDVSNIERGRLSLEVRPEEPSQIALQALHMFEVEAQANGIALEARLPTNMPLVVADRTRVVQVLSNLLRNAIKFTPRDGRIEICAEPRDAKRRLLGDRHGSGNQRRETGSRLRPLLAVVGRRAPARRRPGTLDRERNRRGARRPDLGAQRARRGKRVRFHHTASRAARRAAGGAMSTTRKPTTFFELTRDEAVDLLTRNHVGRLAFSFHDRVDIEPISYVFSGDWVYARTAPGTKLAIVQHHPWVAFEVDEIRSRVDWRSVVVHGTIYFIDAEPRGRSTRLRSRREDPSIRRRRCADVGRRDAAPGPAVSHPRGRNRGKGREAGRRVDRSTIHRVHHSFRRTPDNLPGKR